MLVKYPIIDDGNEITYDMENIIAEPIEGEMLVNQKIWSDCNGTISWSSYETEYECTLGAGCTGNICNGEWTNPYIVITWVPTCTPFPLDAILKDDHISGGGGNVDGNVDAINDDEGNLVVGTTPFDKRRTISEILKDLLGIDLNNSQEFWVENNYDQAQTIVDFLNANNTPEAQNFANEAFEALMNGADVDFEEKIIIDLTEREKCIYNLIKDTPLYKQTIGTFDKADSEYYLTITNEGTCSYADDMCTDGGEIEQYCVTIIVQNHVDTLEFAAAMLHEGIHAEIFKYVQEHEDGVDPQNRAQLLFYYFENLNAETGEYDTTNAQHQYMADNFVTPIAETIRALDNNQYSLDYYMGFGWDGLRRYGYGGYYDNGVWTSLTDSTSDIYYQYQDTVMNTTNFANNCN